MRALPRVLLLSAATLLAPGCRKLADTLFIIDMENKEICRTQRDLTLPATPPGTTSLSQDFQFPLGQAGAELPDGSLETELRLRLFEVNVTGGGADLSGIEYAKVSLRRPGSTEIIRTLIEYHRPEQVFSTTRLILHGIEPVAVPQLAREDTVELVFEARGSLPEQAWTADFKACAGLWARVHYFDFIY